jgi:ribosomal protein S18 acetylase RimI-like enzyme
MIEQSSDIRSHVLENIQVFSSPRVSGYSERIKELCQRIKDLGVMLWISIKSALNLSDYTITLLDLNKLPVGFEEKLKAFEASFNYPFSDTQQFRIEHGKSGDYFAFFKQLGKVYYYAATSKRTGEIAAVGCGVLRTLNTHNGKPTKTWYICDLKVGEKFRGQHIPLMLFQNAAWRIFQCPRGFGICMNPPEGEPKAAKLWRSHGPVSGSTQTMNLYTLTGEEVILYGAQIETLLREKGYLGQDQYLIFKSTDGMKDYQIFAENTQATHPWLLAHAQPGPQASFVPEPGKTYMISAMDGTPLDNQLNALLGKKAPSTAQVVSYSMKKVDFNFLTSNQI